jgi:hypothetical protein
VHGSGEAGERCAPGGDWQAPPAITLIIFEKKNYYIKKAKKSDK